MKTTTESSQTPAIGHDQLAHDAEIAYHALTRIGRQLGRVDPVAGTVGRALIDTFAGLAELRRLLDEHRTVVELCSPDGSPYYPTRSTTPTAATRAAARIAIAATWPYGADEHANADRVPRGTLRAFSGPGREVPPATGDEDRGPSQDSEFSLRRTSSQTPASVAIAATDAHHHDEIERAATQPHSATRAV